MEMQFRITQIYSQKINQYIKCFLSLFKITLKKHVQAMSELQWTFLSDINDALGQTHTLMGASLRHLATPPPPLMDHVLLSCPVLASLPSPGQCIFLQDAVGMYSLHTELLSFPQFFVCRTFSLQILYPSPSRVCKLSLGAYPTRCKGWLVVESLGPNDCPC